MVRRKCTFGLAAVLAAGSLLASSAWAQQGNGVVVDANGVLATKVFTDPTGQLTRQRLAAAKASLNPDLLKRSEMRYVSLTRLEARLASGAGVTDDMRYLAGLTRIRRVFIFPESGDVVIAGPAEGFMPNVAGRMVGLFTGRATLELQDLVVALRAYPPTGKQTEALVVSIDPTKEGLAKMQQFLIDIRGRITPNDAGNIAAGLRQNLGLQNVRIVGVSPKTHFAQVLVEADYRMKLIGIGLETAPVRIQSYVARANPRSVARNALQRWYFTHNYDCVLMSPDALAMELQGDGVQLISEDQMVEASGGRVATGRTDPASQAFVKNFTDRYAELARVEPVYAQMRNLIDMAIAAAFIQKHDYYGRASWKMDFFGSEEKFPVETHPAPTHVESTVNVVWKGMTLMTPIGGGVSIRPLQALSSEHLKTDDEGSLKKLRNSIPLDGLAKDQWWWD